jgi:FMN phosphatase YigB (HAD superfamily)
MPASRPRALVFDAYGTLFDVHAPVRRHAEAVGPEADRLRGPLAGVHAAPLPGDDQALFLERPHRLLDRHPGDAIASLQLLLRGQLLPRLDLAREDRSTDSRRHLQVGRTRVVRVKAHASTVATCTTETAIFAYLLTWLAKSCMLILLLPG